MEEKKLCKMVEDLLPLYTEEMCSQETSAIVEEHIAQCASCMEKYENYQQELETMMENGQAERKEQTEKELQPMRKVKRKLRKSRWLARILAFILIVVVGKVAMMTYGQFHPGTFTNFEQIVEKAKITRILNEMSQGDYEGFLNCIEYNSEQPIEATDNSDSSSQTSSKTYTAKELLRQSMETHFTDKDIKVDWVGTGYHSVTAYGIEKTELEIDAGISINEVRFYFTFTKRGAGRYSVIYSADIETSAYSALDMDRFDDVLYYIQHNTFHEKSLLLISANVEEAYQYMLENNKEKIQEKLQHASMGFDINKPDSSMKPLEVRHAYEEAIQNRLYQLYQKGYYLKSCYAKAAIYDIDIAMPKREIIFLFENQENKDNIMLLQEFNYGYGYKITGQPPVLSGNVPENVEPELLGLFWEN